MPCQKCVELERQLKAAWEQILRMDGELKKISNIVNSMFDEPPLIPDDPQT